MTSGTLASQPTMILDLRDKQYQLLEPIEVEIELSGDNVIVSDQQVNMYGCGTTLNEALVDYRTSLIDYFEWLASHQPTLAPHLGEHLDWLRRHLQVWGQHSASGSQGG